MPLIEEPQTARSSRTIASGSVWTLQLLLELPHVTTIGSRFRLPAASMSTGVACTEQLRSR